jgi:hypothetical protein
MHVIGVSADLQRLAVQVFTDASQVAVQFSFGGWVDQMYTMLGAESDVQVIFNQ